MGTHPIFESDFDCLTELFYKMDMEMVEYDSDTPGEDLNISRISEDDSDENDSDEELRVAYETGLIKPGTTINMPGSKKRKVEINNITALSNKLKEIKNAFDWTQRLDLTIKIDPEVDENGVVKMAGDDFVREEHFQKIAQRGAIEGVLKAKKFNLPLLRPNDYFAEMAKSDE